MARRSQRSLEGELFIDHRHSPGIPPALAVLMGVPISAVAKGQLYEVAVYVCSHCDAEIIKNHERTRPRGHCQKCHQVICDPCDALLAQTGECRERSIRIAEFEARVRHEHLILGCE